MAPSRGPPTTTPPTTAAAAAAIKSKDSDDIALEAQSTSSLTAARRNFAYLISPSSTNAPARLRTRALLRSVRYITQFIIWRVVRWAKYAAIAAISATAIGTLITPIGWIAAPTGIGASIAAATVWGVGKFVARRLQMKFNRAGSKEDGLDVDIREEREREMEMRRKLEREGAGLRGMPW